VLSGWWLLGVSLASDCATCHAEQAHAHARSRHGQAFANPSFRAAWSRHPDPWCLTCHARGGVTCEACHGEPSMVRVARRPPGPVEAEAPHGFEVVPDLGTTACAGCHQVMPPEATVALQTTMSEHTLSTGHCAGCHLPGGDHGLRGGARDVDGLREVLSVTWASAAQGWAATVRAEGVGHAVPTGDPFRQLLVEIGSGDQVVDRARLGRAVQGVGAGLEEVMDTRLPAPGADGATARTVQLHGTATWWRLRFELVDPTHDELVGLEAGWVVHEGSLR